jgi:hypothetical protein
MTPITKESIQAVLLRKDEVGMHAVGRALQVLVARQTMYERRTEATINRNNVGFTPSDAKRGTSMAGYYLRNGYLTEKQLAYWQEPARTEAKRIRITKYHRQLLEAALEKQAAKLRTQAQSELPLAA